MVDRAGPAPHGRAFSNDGADVVSERQARKMLERLQRETFPYFERETNPDKGLVADSNQPGSPASIAAMGLGLSAYVVALERGFMAREAAVTRTLTMLRFLRDSPQSTDPDATGYRGFYYHFLDMRTGRRAWDSELSTIDTAVLLAGVLTVGRYFCGASADETEIRALADGLYRRVDWAWLAEDTGTLVHGWTPEGGRLPCSWNLGYSEAHLLYVLALGSPTFPIAAAGYRSWTESFEAKTAYGIEYLYAGPLFIHQLPQVWLDLRGVNDARNRAAGFDYFENSRRATFVHRAYAIDNPHRFKRYSRNAWGITASDGPGPAVLTIDGEPREFYGYLARGAPFGPDDGTISPWAVVSSLPFAPEIVVPAIHHAVQRLALGSRGRVGFDASFNQTFPEWTHNLHGWVSPRRIGLNQGTIILMIENYLSELLWKLFRQSLHVVRGMQRAGFEGGWLAR